MALRNAAATGILRVSTVVVGMIITPYVLHRLGKDLYGVVVAAGSAYDYLSLMRGGMGSALRRFVTLHFHAGRRESARRYYAVGMTWSNLVRGATLVAAVALAFPICRFLHLPGQLLRDGAWGVALMLAAAVVADAATMLEIPTYSTGRINRISDLRTVMVWVRIAVIVGAFSLFVPSLRIYGISLIVLEMIPLLVLAWMGQRTGVVGPVLPLPQAGDSSIRRDLFQYGGFALLSEVAGLLYVSTDNLMIGRIYGIAAVTRYSMGTRWSPLILGLVVSSISSLTPLFTQLEARGETQRSRDALLRVVGLTATLAVPFCLVPCVVGDLFLTHWVGAEYRGSAAYMIAMLAPGTLEASLAPVWMALIARGRIGRIAAGDIIAAVGNVGISLLLALPLHLGLLGFALGNTLALLAKNILLRPLVGRREPSFPSLGELLAPIPRAVAGALPGLLLLYLLRGVYGGSLAGVLVAGLLGGAVCLAGAAWSTLGISGIRSLLRMAGQAAGRQA